MDYFYSFYQFHSVKELISLLQFEDLEENKIHNSIVEFHSNKYHCFDYLCIIKIFPRLCHWPLLLAKLRITHFLNYVTKEFL